MLSSAEFKKFTGVAREASVDQMVAQLAKKVAQENDSLIGQALLSHELVNTYQWKVNASADATGLTSNQVRLAAQRGAILSQCVAEAVPSVFASLKSASAERTVKMNAECLTIMEAERVGRYVVETLRAEIVAAQVQSTPENHETIVAMLDNKGITTPAAIRHAIPTLAKSIEVKMPSKKRQTGTPDAAAGGVPTMTKVAEAITAWTADRDAGSDKETPFKMHATEVTAAVQAIGRLVHQLVKAGEIDALIETLEIVDTAIADATAATTAEPLAQVEERLAAQGKA